MNGSYEFLDVKIEDRIAFITFNRPDKMNAINFGMFDEMPRALKDFDQSGDADVAVISGNGRAFSIGGDLDLVSTIGDAGVDMLPYLIDNGRQIVHTHANLDKPTVSAINGPALGGGTTYGLMCDFIVMERQAMICDGHLRGALAAGDGGVLTWVMSMGLVKAKKFLMTGDWITAEEAERLGLITEVVEEGDSLKRATEIAVRLAGCPQDALRFTKRSLNQWFNHNMSMFEYSVALEALSMALPDAKRSIANLKQAKRVSAVPPDPRNPKAG